jgi:hypothetical protein
MFSDQEKLQKTIEVVKKLKHWKVNRDRHKYSNSGLNEAITLLEELQKILLERLNK